MEDSFKNPVKITSIPRVRSELIPHYGDTETTYDWGVIPDGGSNPRSPGASSAEKTYEKYRQLTDYVTPGFRYHSKAGRIVNKPAQFISYTEKRGITPYRNYYIDSTDTTGSGGGFDDHGSMSVIRMLSGLYTEKPHEVFITSKPDFSVAKQEAINEAFAGIGEAKADLLTSAAEFGKTVDSVISLFKRAAPLLKREFDLKRAVKRYFKKRTRSKIPERLSKDWLEVRYGLRPIYYDVKNIMEALQSGRPVRTTARGFRTVSETYESSLTHSGAFGSMNVEIAKKREYSVNIRAGCLCEIPSKYLRGYHTFGMDQALETAWDLTPYSFIIDWFYDVGTILAAATPNIGVNVLAKFLVIEEKILDEVACTLVDKPTYNAAASGRTRDVSGHALFSRETSNWYRYNTMSPGFPLGSTRINLSVPKLVDLFSIFAFRGYRSLRRK